MSHPQKSAQTIFKKKHSKKHNIFWLGSTFMAFCLLTKKMCCCCFFNVVVVSSNYPCYLLTLVSWNFQSKQMEIYQTPTKDKLIFINFCWCLFFWRRTLSRKKMCFVPQKSRMPQKSLEFWGVTSTASRNDSFWGFNWWHLRKWMNVTWKGTISKGN